MGVHYTQERITHSQTRYLLDIQTPERSGLALRPPEWSLAQHRLGQPWSRQSEPGCRIRASRNRVTRDNELWLPFTTDFFLWTLMQFGCKENSLGHRMGWNLPLNRRASQHSEDPWLWGQRSVLVRTEGTDWPSCLECCTGSLVSQWDYQATSLPGGCCYSHRLLQPPRRRTTHSKLMLPRL